MLQSSLCHSPPTTSWLLFTRRRPAPCAMEAWHENGQSCRRGAYRAAALRPAPTRHQADVGQARRAIRQGRLAAARFLAALAEHEIAVDNPFCQAFPLAVARLHVGKPLAS